MLRKLFWMVFVITLLFPANVRAQESDECDLNAYLDVINPLLAQIDAAQTPDEIDAARVGWHEIDPDVCYLAYHRAVEYALSEDFIGALLRESEPVQAQQHAARAAESWQTALDLFPATAESGASENTSGGEGETPAETPSELDDPNRPGTTPETALLIGTPGPILHGAGTFVVERVIRGATGYDASVAGVRAPQTGNEWMLVWATFTCDRSFCNEISKSPFFIYGSEKVFYGNKTLQSGSFFDQQLHGQPFDGGSVSGWLLFEISTTDSNLILVDDDGTGTTTTYFALTAFPPDAELLTVTGNSVNLRSCAGTDCDIVGTANAGDQLMNLGAEGDWFHIRAEDGTEGYIFGQFVSQP